MNRSLIINDQLAEAKKLAEMLGRMDSRDRYRVHEDQHHLLEVIGLNCQHNNVL